MACHIVNGSGGMKIGKVATGFTLIELLVVLAIIATLMSIAAPRFRRAASASLSDRVRGLWCYPGLRGSARAYRGSDWVCSGKVAVGGRPKAALLPGNVASLPPPGIYPQVSAKQSLLAGNRMLRLRGSC